MDNQQFQERLKALRQNYLAQLPEKAQQIRLNWDTRAEGNAADRLAEMRRLVHNLAGSGATFGCQDVGAVAGRLEMLLNGILATTESISETQKIRVGVELDALDEILKQYAATPGENGVMHAPPVQAYIQARPDNPPKERVIYLVGEDAEFAQQFADRLAQHDYRVRIFSDFEALAAALKSGTPIALAMDMVLPSSEFGGAEFLRKLHEQAGKIVPAIFLSVRDDFESRLAAARAGATHYLTKPLDVLRTVQLLDDYFGSNQTDPYRVLVVDDDTTLADMYRMYLEEAGLSVVTVNDPLAAMGKLNEYEPDLVLMDINMPQCNGLELASVIRQHEEFDQIPIVFLTADGQTDIKLAAMNLGGDEFLTKPVLPWHLVSAIMARIKRARALRHGAMETQRALHELEKFKEALDQHAIVSTTDASGTIIYVNDKFCEISGYSRAELIGQNHRVIKSSAHPLSFYEQMWTTICSGQVWHGELRNRKKGGGHYWVESTIVPFLDDFGVPQRFISLRTDITQIKGAENDLVQAKDEAERANRAKSDFLSSMSHELRTPMNAILGFGQLLESDSDEPLTESQAESVDQILRAGWHLLDLINEVLDLAKVESGKIELSIENVDPLEVLRECVDLMSSVAAGSRIQVSLDITSDTVHVVRADRTRLKQALLNLIANAIKYNRKNGLVTISAHYTGEAKLRLCVMDTGVGLSAEQQQRLFQPFDRLGAEHSGVEGTGIGLVITKQIVELMGGAIGVESEQSHGSTFWIELDAVDECVGLPENMHAGDMPELHGIARRTVLYVEDNPANLRLVAQALGRLPNIKLLSAHTGELGLDLARSNSPDLIILDINLPGMDGYALRARLRLYEETKHIPVIALSANAMPRDIERGLQAGFDRYLTKPLKVVEFMKALNELMSDSTDSEN